MGGPAICPYDGRGPGGMTSDLDIWRAANLLIRRHGSEAEMIAARRADEMLERGDHDGQHLWLRIRPAIAEWQAEPIGSVHCSLWHLSPRQVGHSPLWGNSCRIGTAGEPAVQRRDQSLPPRRTGADVRPQSRHSPPARYGRPWTIADLTNRSGRIEQTVDTSGL
jgi:hypothetical protein